MKLQPWRYLVDTTILQSFGYVIVEDGMGWYVWPLVEKPDAFVKKVIAAARAK